MARTEDSDDVHDMEAEAQKWNGWGTAALEIMGKTGACMLASS